MAQSTDSNLRGIPRHTVESPTQWTNWIDQFHSASMAKENLNIDNLNKKLESETIIPILEGSQESETDTKRKTRVFRNKEVVRVYENTEDKRITEDKRKMEG